MGCYGKYCERVGQDGRTEVYSYFQTVDFPYLAIENCKHLSS